MVASPPPEDDNDEFDEDDAFWSLRFILEILPDIIFGQSSFIVVGFEQRSTYLHEFGEK